MSRHEFPPSTSVASVCCKPASGVGCLALAGCSEIVEPAAVARTLSLSEQLNQAVHRRFRTAMAQEFSPADLSPVFRVNGTELPDDADYQALAQMGFAAWTLEVAGLVERPMRFTLAERCAMPSRMQLQNKQQ